MLEPEPRYPEPIVSTSQPDVGISPKLHPKPPPWTVGHTRFLDHEEEREALRGPQNGAIPGGIQGKACHAQSWAEQKRTFEESFLFLKLVTSSKEVTKGIPSMPLTHEH